MTTVEPEPTAKKMWSSYSALTLHRECPQAYNYRKIRKLTHLEPEQVSVAMDLGTWWHALTAAESLVRGKALASLKFLPEFLSVPSGVQLSKFAPEGSIPGDVTPRDVLRFAGQWWNALRPEAQQVWLEAYRDTPLPAHLLWMYNSWIKYWREERADELPLAVEVQWKRDLPALGSAEYASELASRDEVQSPEATLIGYIDEVYFDKKRNLVVARDRKVHKTLGTQTSADDMMDSQLQLYAWGANPEIEKWGYGPIRATSYDRIRGSAAKEPKVTATTGKLSASVNDFDLDTYLKWAQGPDGLGVPWGDPEAVYATGARKGEPKPHGRYTADPEVIDRLSGVVERSKWLQRTLTPISRRTMDTHVRAAVDSALDVRRTRARVKATGGEAQRNLRWSCRNCMFVKLCRAELVGGVDGDYDLADFGLRPEDDRDRRQ